MKRIFLNAIKWVLHSSHFSYRMHLSLVLFFLSKNTYLSTCCLFSILRYFHLVCMRRWNTCFIPDNSRGKWMGLHKAIWGSILSDSKLGPPQSSLIPCSSMSILYATHCQYYSQGTTYRINIMQHNFFNFGKVWWL